MRLCFPVAGDAEAFRSGHIVNQPCPHTGGVRSLNPKHRVQSAAYSVLPCLRRKRVEVPQCVVIRTHHGVYGKPFTLTLRFPKRRVFGL